MVLSIKSGGSQHGYLTTELKQRDNRDLTGEMFGCWKVISKNPKKAYWLCECVCGNRVEKSTFLLVNSKSVQCATCHRKERMNKRNSRRAFQIKNGFNVSSRFIKSSEL